MTTTPLTIACSLLLVAIATVLATLLLSTTERSVAKRAMAIIESNYLDAKAARIRAARRPRIQAKWNVRKSMRLDRTTAPALGASKRQGRL